MSAPDITISSDWDIIEDDAVHLIGKTISEETITENSEEKEPVQKGSCVDDILEPENPCVPEINHNENSSSSEFDVLEESAEDNHGNLSFSNMEYSISSSLESSHLSLVSEAVQDNPDVELLPEPRTPQEITVNVSSYFLAIAAALAIIAILITSLPIGSMQQMKERISSLQTENDELKSLVQSKYENDKLLLALEEQIKSLKDENFKLSESMKALVAQLEEQTTLLKMDKTKLQDPFRSEIERLKEQINILQIDNEDLQQQLVRTRYGIYSPQPKEQNAEPPVKEKEEQKEKPDNQDNRDNSSEILVEEINELRKKLYAEVEKLKSWKDSVQHIVKKLESGQAGSFEDNGKEDLKDKESFEHPKSSSEKEKVKKPKHGKKDGKFSEWTWADMKKNFKSTFGNLQDIDVPNMFSDYVDKKRIESVFESVGHYFKKAQEKTKKVLNFNKDINEEMWNFFGQLRNKWNDISNKYQKYSSRQSPPKAEDYKSQYHKHKQQDTQGFETGKKFDRYQKQHKEEKASDDTFDRNLYPDLESFTTSPVAETPENEMVSEDKVYEDNSWVFRRAAHRSQLREEEQEAFTNWFLKRGQDFHYNEHESLKEWFRETYQNGNSDEE